MHVVASSDVCDLYSRLLAQSDINTTNVADRVNETNVLFTPIPGVQVKAVDIVYVADILQKATFLKEISEDVSSLSHYCHVTSQTHEDTFG